MANITLITLQEPMMYLEGLFKPSNRLHPADHRKYTISNFNAIPYMTLLLQEITSESFSSDINNVPPSTTMLIRHGMPEELAIQTGLTIFKMVVDIISEAIPEMCFNATSNEYLFDFMGNYDLSISWNQWTGIEKNVFD